MKKSTDVTALGELLIDFTECGVSPQGNPLLEANPGGAPCNVLAMLAKLGRRTAFIGKVGRDSFGKSLCRAAAEAGIDVGNLLFDDRVPTTLAFVHNAPDGERDFSFYRNPGADVMLRPEEVSEDLIARSRIFHFGSLSMTHPESRAATKRALQLAHKHSCLVSFDPNLREPLWDDPEEAGRQIAFGLGQCDVLKIADNELKWFTGRADLAEGVRELQDRYDIPLLLVSRGRDGSSAFHRGMRVDEAAFLMDNTVDTTGAGDAFCACVLHFVLEWGADDLREAQLREMLRFANAAAALVTTKRGALRVMPTAAETETLLAERQQKSPLA